jgi:methionyl-tRNA formyltransferase
MRILFAASPDIAVPALETLAGGFELAGVLTNPDSPRGRRSLPEPTEVGAAVERLAGAGKGPFPLLKPEKLDALAREQVLALGPDLLVSFAYGRIFGPRFLALFPMGGINIHPSLLPQYRGPAPIPAAILNRDRQTGITIQRLAREMDSGDVLAQEQVDLTGRETSRTLGAIMANKAAQMLPAALKGLADGTLRAVPQDHRQATYCPLLTKEDGHIDWTQSAADIDARIRAFDPWPLSWTSHGEQRLFILRAEPVPAEDAAQPLAAAQPSQTGLVLGIDKQRGILVQTGAGVLAVSELQYQAKKALQWRDFLNGARNFTGCRLG